MINNDITLNYSIRFFCSTEQQADEITQICSGITVIKNKQRRKDGKWIVVINIDSNTVTNSIRNAILTGSKFDHFISLVSESDTNIISLPDYVMKCVREWLGPVNFSFTVVS